MTTKHLKADIPLAERQRLEREQWTEIRAALVRRHFQTVQDQMAIDATLARLEREHLQSIAPAITAIMAGRDHNPVPVPTTAIPETAAAVPALMPAPVAMHPRSPDGLRQRFGLR